MSGFITDLDCQLKTGSDEIWVLHSPLIYNSDLFGQVVIPAGFMSDLSSVPRVPLIYAMWGGRAHREGIVHDAAYRIDFPVKITFCGANDLFLEAMDSRGKPWYIRWGMYAGVCIGGYPCWHKRKMTDSL